MNTDNASILYSKQVDEADLCTETLILPSSCRQDTTQPDPNENFVEDGGAGDGGICAEEPDRSQEHNDNELLVADVEEGRGMGMVSPQGGEDIGGQDGGQLDEEPIATGRDVDPVALQESNRKPKIDSVEELRQDEEEYIDSERAQRPTKASQERFHLFSQDDCLPEEHEADRDKDESLDAILDSRGEEYAPPLDPPYGFVMDSPAFAIQGRDDFELEDGFEGAVEFGSTTGPSGFEDLARAAYRQECQNVEQVRPAELAIERTAEYIHVLRSDKEGFKKRVRGISVSSSSVLGKAFDSVNKPSWDLKPFPSGCKYRIGQMNPILQPIQASHQACNPEADGLQAGPTPSPNQHKEERVIGTLTAGQRKERVKKYLEKRKKRIWKKKVSYDCRKRVAERRLRIKGKFVGREMAAALLGAEAADLSKNELVQSALQTNSHCSIISSANNLKIRNLQSLFNPIPQSDEYRGNSSGLKRGCQTFEALPGTSAQRIDIPTPYPVVEKPTEKDLGKPAQFSLVPGVPVVMEPLFVYKRKKLDVTAESHLKHHKS